MQMKNVFQKQDVYSATGCCNIVLWGRTLIGKLGKFPASRPISIILVSSALLQIKFQRSYQNCTLNEATILGIEVLTAVVMKCLLGHNVMQSAVSQLTFLSEEHVASILRVKE
jgi:hypothetical protein